MGLIGDRLRTDAQAVDSIEAEIVAKNSQITVLQTQVTDLQRQLAECRDQQPTPQPTPVTVAVSSTGAVTVNPAAGARVEIKNSAGMVVYSGGTGGGNLPAGSYTWTATAQTGYAISGPSSGAFTVAPSPQLPDIPAGTEVNATEVAAKLAAAPNGAVFRVRPGTAGGTLTLKPGQQVWALDPANPPLFDGGGTQWFAKGAGGSAADTVLGYIRWKNYAPANPTWVNVEGDTYRRQGGVEGGSLPRMRLFRCEGFENGWAISCGNGMVIEECLLHHNHHMSIGGYQRTGIRIIKGEWHNNNRRPDGRPYYNWRWEAGNKLVSCKDVVYDGLYSHHNIGPGIWADGSNDRFVIKNNRCEDNDADGIFWEISYQAIIENNRCLRNKNAANIYISNSRGHSATDPVVVRGNVESGHPQWGIGLSNSAARQPYLDFIKIENNTVSGVIKKYTIGTPPATTSIVVTGNKKPDGTAVGLT